MLHKVRLFIYDAFMMLYLELIWLGRFWDTFQSQGR